MTRVPFLRRFPIIAVLGLVLVLQPHEARAQQWVIDTSMIGQSVAQWAKEATQWVTSNMLSAAHSAATVGSGWAQSEANLTLAQATVNAALGRQVGATNAQYAVKSSFPAGMTYCPHVMAEQYTQTAHDALDTLKQALRAATFWSGAGVNDVLGGAQMLSQLCTMSLVSQQDGGCASAPAYPQYADRRVWTGLAVVAGLSYPFPSNLATDGNGHLNFTGAPQQQDMPAVAAIWSCILRHEDTGVPISSTRPTTPQLPQQRFMQLRAQGQAASIGDLCLDEVAKRLAVPSNAGGQLQQIYQANAKLCQQMKNEMQPADYQNCVGSQGVSWLTIRRAKACRDTPQNVQSDLGADEDVAEEKKNIIAGKDRCDASIVGQDRESVEFMAMLARSQDSVGGEKVEASPAERPFSQ